MAYGGAKRKQDFNELTGAGGGVQKSPSPYLKYSRDIQNLYKKYRQEQ